MNVVGYSEGIHILDSVLIGAVGFTSSNVGGSGHSVEGLYIRGCEVQCTSVALQITQVWGAWINDNHLGASATANTDSVVEVLNSANIFMSNLWITGTQQAGVYGLTFSGGAINRVNGLTLENLSSGVLFTRGVTGTLILGLQMVNQNLFPNLLDSGLVVDNSGNTANNAQWQPSSGPLKYLY